MRAEIEGTLIDKQAANERPGRLYKTEAEIAALVGHHLCQRNHDLLQLRHKPPHEP